MIGTNLKMDVEREAARPTHKFNYAITAHRPTAVTQCVVGSFTSPDEVNLIIGYVEVGNCRQ